MNGDAYMARMPTKITIRYEKSISILVRSAPDRRQRTSHKAPARRAGVVSPDGTPRWQAGRSDGVGTYFDNAVLARRDFTQGGRGGIKIWICTHSAYPDFKLSGVSTVVPQWLQVCARSPHLPNGCSRLTLAFSA